MQVLYNLIVKIYGLIIYCASVNKIKAKQWVDGRKLWRLRMPEQLSKLKHSTTIWFHCASYGEFEQGAPLIEVIKKKNNHFNIVVTFFSPSGYLAFKNTTLADVVLYLPLDTPRNAKDFIQLLRPQIAIFVKYEFWLNYLKQLRIQKVPTYLVSATFKPHHPFFKWYGSIFIESLSTFKVIYLQDVQSKVLLGGIGVNHTKIAGDTRFDRVYQNKLLEYDDEIIINFKEDKRLFVAGSTWPNDDDYVIDAIRGTRDSGFKYLIAPHEVDELKLSRLYEKLIQKDIKYTVYTDYKSGADVLIVNCLGVLSKIYKYADFSYVGGGFNNNGIHNVLEPTVFGKPSSFFGENYRKFNEIIELKEIACVLNLSSDYSLTDVIKNYDRLDLVQIRNRLVDYFNQRLGSTNIIANDILEAIKS